MHKTLAKWDELNHGYQDSKCSYTCNCEQKAVDAKLVILFNLSRFAFYYVMFVGTENLVSHRWTQINIVYSAQYRDTLIEISG